MYRAHVRNASQHTITTIDERDSSWKGRSIRKFKQFANDVMAQRLHGRYSMPTAITVLPACGITGIICILIGLFIFFCNYSVYTVEFEYKLSDGCLLERCFYLDQPLKGPISINYKLHNVHFNHRKMSSENRGYCEGQLLGENSTDFVQTCLKNGLILPKELKKLIPSTMLEEFTQNREGQFYAPMGPLANAKFNDTYQLQYLYNSVWTNVPLTTHGIVGKRENDSYAEGGCNAEHFLNTAKPPNYPRHLCEEGGYRNVDFIVWMRTTAHQTFKKIFRFIDFDKKIYPFDKHYLPAGKYRILIENNYNLSGLPTTAFSEAARKSVVIFRPSWYGHRDEHLHLICVATGIILIGSAICLAILHHMYGNSLEKMSCLEDEEEEIDTTDAKKII